MAGTPRSLSSIALYGNTGNLQLPLKSIEEEFKVLRVREVLQYRESRDPKVSGAGVVVKTGRKWRSEAAVDQAESRLSHGVLVGALARGRAGLGTFQGPRFDKAWGKERRQLVQGEVRAAVEEERFSKAVGMARQGAWTRWEQAVERKITWADLWRAEPHRIKFLVQAVYDVLPSPSNLYTWGLVDTPGCVLCQRKGTLEHILSCCPRALGEGRYHWRHDQVLITIAESIQATINNCWKSKNPKQTICFIRAGEKPERSARARCLPVEVGCRDFAGQSLYRAYTELGITGERRRRRAICNSTEAAEKASRWIWIKRADPWTNAARAQAEA
ncbi:uncharacterized protein LOC109140547, partial [Tachysurus ichikawai]